MQRSLSALGLALVLALATASASASMGFAARPSGAPAPRAEKRPVTDVFHGAGVTEDYRWLEDIASPEVRTWSDGQNRHARSVLDRLPSVRAIRKRITELDRASSPDHYELSQRGGRLFAIKSEPPLQQPFLVTLGSVDDARSTRTVVDPNLLDPKGGTSIDWYVPSRDGRLVAVSLSEGGSESGTVHLYDVESGKALEDVIPRVNGGTAGGSLAWNEDATGFWYTRYPKEGERPKEDLDFYQQVYFHKLGTREGGDTYSIGHDFPRIAEVALQSSDDGRFVLASVENGDGGDYAHYLLGPDGTWKQIVKYGEKVPVVKFGGDGNLYLLSREGAPRGRLLRLAPGAGTLADAEPVVAEGEAAITEFEATATRIHVVGILGGPSRLDVHGLDGARLGSVPILPVSAVDGLTRLSGDEILFRNESYLDPPAWYRLSPAATTPVKTALFRTSPANFRDCEVVREYAVSRDGTRVPMSILLRKGAKRDGRNPALLYGYGGYGINMTPHFSTMVRAWVEQGGVYAVANIRGGSEFGEDWHTAGNLVQKQHVFDDFAACAKRLAEAKYTHPRRLALEGGSNGGLLMGAVLTQHPELMKAVVSHVGIYDMLRVELSPNGAFNVTEFGTVKDPEQFRALHAYSPYHHVRDGASYPATLFLTGENDPRVDPAHSRKMTARLQAASPGTTVLLRTSANSGHGIGSSRSERVEQEVDVYAFLFKELGVKYRPVAEKKLQRELPTR
ncbi:MAG: S9 family peptidase [Candidatus Eisenbacteria bacterium]|nr:S9 family peptidase [Candidatus Eisenbacteria bacterium]